MWGATYADLVSVDVIIVRTVVVHVLSVHHTSSGVTRRTTGPRRALAKTDMAPNVFALDTETKEIVAKGLVIISGDLIDVFPGCKGSFGS